MPIGQISETELDEEEWLSVEDTEKVEYIEI